MSKLKESKIKIRQLNRVVRELKNTVGLYEDKFEELVKLNAIFKRQRDEVIHAYYKDVANLVIKSSVYDGSEQEVLKKYGLIADTVIENSNIEVSSKYKLLEEK